jgi:transcriptional regulator with GAF, ATPase, and Fis domain
MVKWYWPAPFILTNLSIYVKIYHIMEYALLGNHPSIRKIRELITMVSDTAFSVLLLGETGTGKEVVARLLYYSSPRRERRFIKVNCAALPFTLLESELFGYEKGAFTGADKFKPGKFELASEGVILLDEIGDMPLVLQAKLLHVLQTGEFNRLGGTKDISVNAWVIAATNHDLENDIKQGVFREDLFYRLNIIKIEIPPLRERKEDILLLTDHFGQKYCSALKMTEPFVLNPDLRKLFQTYHWPGNVRELSSIVLRLLVGEDPEKVRTELLGNMEADGLGSPRESVEKRSEKIQGADGGSEETEKVTSLKDLRAEAAKYIERKAIIHALNMTGWNKREAAKMLKISYKALFYKIDNYGIKNDLKY